MSYALTYSRAYVGVEAPLVSVETHLSAGLPALTIADLEAQAQIQKHHLLEALSYRRLDVLSMESQ